MSWHALRTVRDTGLSAMRAAGLFSLSAASQNRRERLLILCFHGITLVDEDRWCGHLFISPRQFRQRLEALRSAGANVLPLAEAVDRLGRNSLPPRSVVITFDDGFSDFHRYASPLLQEFGYPSTVYLTTYYCRHSRPIFNLMADYLLWKSTREQVELPGLGFADPLPIQNPMEREKVVRQLKERGAERGGEAEDGMLRQIAEGAGIDHDAILASRVLQLMNPEEVSDIARAGVNIELHTHRHRVPHDRELFLREIRDNTTCIQEITGVRPVHFCYPSGVHDQAFLPWLNESGIRSGTTCEKGLASAQQHPLLLPRMLDDSFVSGVQFDRWISGFRMM